MFKYIWDLKKIESRRELVLLKAKYFFIVFTFSSFITVYKYLCEVTPKELGIYKLSLLAEIITCKYLVLYWFS